MFGLQHVCLPGMFACVCVCVSLKNSFVCVLLIQKCVFYLQVRMFSCFLFNIQLSVTDEFPKKKEKKKSSEAADGRGGVQKFLWEAF